MHKRQDMDLYIYYLHMQNDLDNRYLLHIVDDNHRTDHRYIQASIYMHLPHFFRYKRHLRHMDLPHKDDELHH